MSTKTVDFESGLPADVAQAATSVPEPVVDSTELIERETRSTNRWLGITALTLVFAGIGLLFERPSLVLLAGLGVWYGVYYQLVDEPAPELRVTRRIEQPETAPGDRTRVSLEISNIGETFVPDLRIVDGIPPALALSEGSARIATSLRPGQSARIGYTLEARRGHHEFEPVTVIARDIAGVHEHVFDVHVPSMLHCEPIEESIPALPLRKLTRRVTGRVETSQGGAGLEFFSTRAYRPGDSLNRINWHRHAKTGELTTLEFREEQAATVVLVIDVRPEAYVANEQQELPAADIGTDAGAQLFFSLLDAGDQVGLTTLGARSCWLPPGLGRDHRAAGRILFGGHDSLGPKPPQEHISVDYQRWQLEHRLPLEAQIIYISPFVDSGAERYATILDARGHLVTAISPDPTGRETPGQRIAAVERQLRIFRLRNRGIRVIDWNTDDSLYAAIERATVRWP